eukprot:378664-Rhodomonas_salina.2
MSQKDRVIAYEDRSRAWNHMATPIMRSICPSIAHFSAPVTPVTHATESKRTPRAALGRTWE